MPTEKQNGKEKLEVWGERIGLYYLLREWRVSRPRKWEISGHNRNPLKITSYELTMKSVCLSFEILLLLLVGQVHNRWNTGFK